MNRINLLSTKEDIESYGVSYEPDITKCKSYTTKITYSDFEVDDGILINYPPKGPVAELCKVALESIPYKYVNAVYVNLPEESDLPEGMPVHYHGHPKVFILGHI